MLKVIVWTPGISKGRPLYLDILPDFSALGDDPDESAQAVEMARATLLPFVGAAAGQGRSEGERPRRRVAPLRQPERRQPQ